ncbi:hypothetical protein IWQ57_000290 [Coemansia nantahalensis]|uniref:Uncharacterized protein n=1 Tax=Coemansia nantahalensis TaxID=2789366 RepID=A0ACC1K8M2_9FUNG|nr:hypothetical protein IWQ57_000290 [Coemansia nantahalensis]
MAEVGTALSALLGYLSLGCWIVVLVPQIWLNHRHKSCEGVSLAFYLMWSLGDVFNLAGALLEGLIFTAILLPLYFILTDGIVLAQFYAYRAGPADEEAGEAGPLLGGAPMVKAGRRRPWRPVVLVAVAVTAALAAAVGCLVLPQWLAAAPGLRRAAAQLCGYASAAVYLSAYLPQLVQNYRAKSTEGLSLLTFVIVVAGNITYCLSILTAHPLTREYLLTYASWLLGAAGTIGLELAILAQFYLYRARLLA